MKPLVLAVSLLTGQAAWCDVIDVTNQQAVTLNTGDELQFNFTLNRYYSEVARLGYSNAPVGMILLNFLLSPAPNELPVTFSNSTGAYYPGYSFDFTLSNGTTSYPPSPIETTGVLNVGFSGGASLAGVAEASWAQPDVFQDGNLTMTLVNTGLPITFGDQGNFLFDYNGVGAVSVAIGGTTIDVGFVPDRAYLVSVPEPSTAWTAMIGIALIYGRLLSAGGAARTLARTRAAALA